MTLKGKLFEAISALPLSPENASLVFAVAFNLAMFAVAWAHVEEEVVRQGLKQRPGTRLSGVTRPGDPRRLREPRAAATFQQPKGPRALAGTTPCARGNSAPRGSRPSPTSTGRARAFPSTPRRPRPGRSSPRHAHSGSTPSSCRCGQRPMPCTPRNSNLGRSTSQGSRASRRSPFRIRSSSGSRRPIARASNCTPGSIPTGRGMLRAIAARGQPCGDHATRLVKTYGDQLWLDPGEPGAVEHVLAVVLDVVRRYDVDGVHIDDYFYPYPIEDGPGTEGRLPGRTLLARLPGTRRNAFPRRMATAERGRIRRTLLPGGPPREPIVRVGVSPFGLGRPDRRPPGISGFSQYDKIYANVELWLEQGWLDYLAPQLYWPGSSPGQPFGTLLDYWHAQNPKGRHVWPGLFTSRIGCPTPGLPTRSRGRCNSRAPAAAAWAMRISAWPR